MPKLNHCLYLLDTRKLQCTHLFIQTLLVLNRTINHLLFQVLLKRKPRNSTSIPEIIKSTSNGISYNNQCSTNAYNTSTNARNSKWNKMDSQDYSCAYDSLFTILWNMWSEDQPLIESQAASMWNNYFYTLVNGFPHHHSHQNSLEGVRNTVRNELRHQNSAAFPFGNYGVDIKDLLNMMFKYSSYPPIGYETTFCLDCGLHTPSSIDLDSNIYTFCSRHLEKVYKFT